jgi:hypothetical protein
LLGVSCVGFIPACSGQTGGGGSGGSVASGGGGLGASGGTGGTSGGAADSGGSSSGAAAGLSYVKASNTGAGDLFGIAATLSADGSTLVVGANSEASGTSADQADESELKAGAAYVFVRSAGSWEQQAYLKASSPSGGDAFGTTVALSTDGTTLAVGAPFEASASSGIDGDEDDDTALRAGAVYVFVRSGTSWQQQAYLKASAADADDFFGISIALSADGSVLAVGAEGEDGSASGINGDQSDKTAYESGAVYLFRRSGAAWQQADYIKASNAGVGDHFGGAVSLSADGGLLAVGAYWEDSAATGAGGDQDDDTVGSAGAVYLFGWGGSAWQQTTYLKGPSSQASNSFGSAVSLSADGQTLAVGAVGEASFTGAAHVFGRDESGWAVVTRLTASNAGVADEFGYHLQLAADGKTLAVGAALEASPSPNSPNEDSAPEAGAAYVFGESGGVWSESALIKAPNAEAGDRFGWSVSLNAEGETLVVGATREAGAATGIDGDQADNAANGAGAAYVLELGAP